MSQDTAEEHMCDSCDRVATCVGQFDGSCTPTYGCNVCCDHEEHADGECEPIDFWEIT